MTHHHLVFVVFLASLISCVSPFLITDAEPGIVVVAPGEKVTLKCEVDDHYEYCKFISPQMKPNSSDPMICDLEWKRDQDNITIQYCDFEVAFHGKYDDRQCGITFVASEKDTGVWKCEIEEYVWGGARGSGRKVWAQMNVTVMSPTTTPATVTSTTVSTTTSGATSSSTSSSTTTTESVTSSSSSTDKSKETPSAVPHTDENADGGSSAASTAVSVIAILVILVCVGAGVWYYRRRQMKRPDAGAAVVYDREARLNRDTTNMMRNNSREASVDGSNRNLETVDQRNLHEFFPNSDSFA